MKNFYDFVLYCCKNSKSNTYKVAKKISTSLNIPKINVNKINDKKYKKIIIVCPTCGDEEVPVSMEDFLENIKQKNRKYTICELGNYFGIEDTEFGSGRVIKNRLNCYGWKLINPILSLDTIPKIDWSHLNLWIEKL